MCAINFLYHKGGRVLNNLTIDARQIPVANCQLSNKKRS